MTPLSCAYWTASHTFRSSAIRAGVSRPSLLDELRDRHAVDELEHEVGHGTRGCVRPPHREDARDAGVAEPREEVPLVLEAPDRLGRQELQADDLDRHAATRLVLLPLVDGAHAARGDVADDLVGPDALGHVLVDLVRPRASSRRGRRPWPNDGTPPNRRRPTPTRAPRACLAQRRGHHVVVRAVLADVGLGRLAGEALADDRAECRGDALELLGGEGREVAHMEGAYASGSIRSGDTDRAPTLNAQVVVGPSRNSRLFSEVPRNPRILRFFAMLVGRPPQARVGRDLPLPSKANTTEVRDEVLPLQLDRAGRDHHARLRRGRQRQLVRGQRTRQRPGRPGRRLRRSRMGDPDRRQGLRPVQQRRHAHTPRRHERPEPLRHRPRRHRRRTGVPAPHRPEEPGYGRRWPWRSRGVEALAHLTGECRHGRRRARTRIR